MADNENKDSLINIDFGDSSSKFVAYSIEEIEEFLSKEEKFWKPFTDDSQAPFQTVINNVRTSLNNIRDKVNQYKAKQAKVDQIIGAFHVAFNGHGRGLLHSSTREAKLIAHLKIKYGMIEAKSALAFLLQASNPQFELRNIQQMRGIFSILAMGEDMLPVTPNLVEDSLKDISSRYYDLYNSDLAKFVALQKDFATLRNEVELALETGRRWFRLRRREYGIQAKMLAADAKQDLKDVDALYREHMKLKAPVEYWKKKADNHDSLSTKYRILVIWYAVIFSFLLISSVLCLIFASYGGVINVMRTDPITLIPLGVIGLSILTLGFWAGRVLVRLFLSEHHLAIDARERETMALTYLALIAERAADETDRAIVLSALFRPTADGIVKDDGAPDLSLPGILSKILDKR